MDGANPLLHQAAATGNELLLTELLSQPGCPPLDQHDSLGLTPVHHAAALPSAACLRVLLETGGQPNCKDSAGRCPLHRAALCGRAECCRVLLLAGEQRRHGLTGQQAIKSLFGSSRQHYLHSVLQELPWMPLTAGV